MHELAHVHLNLLLDTMFEVPTLTIILIGSHKQQMHLTLLNDHLADNRTSVYEYDHLCVYNQKP
ncbi:unnamed protein product [Schistosoma margrebowiei]|uniref:Uncharacterized protein n=1 Tax=Schistosoma margrebowiei TaxID=48269 RepID=A0A3P8CR35_9TREM|nr:unnamed protein product [Schistosoma margrebowiei]